MSGRLLTLLFLICATVTSVNGQEAEAYFKTHLNECKADEIRCLYFLDDNPKIGEVMTIDLRSASVFTVRKVFDWASQSSENRKLSHTQTETLRKLISDLPPSHEKLQFKESLLIAIRRDDGIHLFQYRRQKPPSVIQRIYDIGGGYLQP